MLEPVAVFKTSFGIVAGRIPMIGFYEVLSRPAFTTPTRRKQNKANDFPHMPENRFKCSHYTCPNLFLLLYSDL